jgi:hypothetical protein
MWGRKNKTVESKFWSGESISLKTLTSFFGQFMRILKDLFQDENPNEVCSKLTIPKVIVIGAESGGKSSLLENIIKCPIFPRNSNICTRQPIHLVLRNVTNPDDIIYKIVYQDVSYNITDKNQLMIKIQEIMSRLDNEDISSEEIHVEIHDLDLPNFEFYDLPGIRAYPAEMATKTKNLAEEYIKQPNTIILCVVPATTPRITSYLPIALIKNYNKEANTIIALTMADRVGPENIYELLIKRIINETDEFNQTEFAGCVAVINRSHVDSTTLEENDFHSNKWFTTNIINEIPEDLPKQSTELIHKNIGIGNLINNLDTLYNKFIKNNWIPQTIVELETNLERIDTQLLEDYYVDFEDINKYSLMIEILYKIYIQLKNYNVDFHYIHEHHLESNRENCVHDIPFSVILFAIKKNAYIEKLNICEIKTLPCKFQEKNEYELFTSMSDIDDDKYFNYNDIEYYIKNEINTNRFRTLIDAVEKFILDSYNSNINTYFEYDKPQYYEYYKKCILCRINPDNATNAYKGIFYDTIAVCKKEIMISDAFELDEFINLKEDQDYLNDKKKLVDELDYTDQAIQKIKNLRLQMN